MARLKKRADGRLQKSFTYNGKRYYVYGYSKQELDEKEYLKRQELEAGLDRRENPTLKQYYEAWTEARRDSVREATLHAQASWFKVAAEIRIDSAGKNLEDMKIADITVDDIRESQKKLREGGRRSAQTINDIIAHLSHVFKTAVNERKIDYNPCTLVRPLKRTEERARDTKHRALTREETRAFFDAAAGSYYYNVFLFAINTGMRCGEIGALYATDIKDGMIHVERTLTRLETGGYEIGDSAKTEKGRRLIPVNDTINRIIEEQKRFNRMVRGEKVTVMHELLFTAPEGKYLLSEVLGREMKRICKAAGLKPFTMHAFRSTFATRAIEQGVNPRTVQELLGHTDFSITMNLYGHVLDNTKQEAMNKLASAI